jgi:hypothetical protein
MESFMKLTRYKEFKRSTRNLPKDRVIQYIIIMYDPASKELEQEFPHLMQRKVEAAKAAGLMVAKSRMAPEVEDMLIGKNENINAMIIRYLHLFNDPNLLMLESYKSMYAALNQAVMGGQLEVREYSKAIQNIETLNTSIIELSNKVLRGRDETQLREDLYRSIEGRELGIRVEDVAEKLQRGEDPFPEANPYGQMYKPKKLKFVGDK